MSHHTYLTTTPDSSEALGSITDPEQGGRGSTGAAPAGAHPHLAAVIHTQEILLLHSLYLSAHFHSLGHTIKDLRALQAIFVFKGSFGQSPNSSGLVSQCFFQDFHPIWNLIGSKLYLKDYFHVIIDVISPDQCSISHHAEQNQLENSTEAVHFSCSEFRETFRHSSASSSVNAP